MQALRHAARFLGQPHSSLQHLWLDRLLLSAQAHTSEGRQLKSAWLLGSSAALAVAAIAAGSSDGSEGRGQAHCAAELPLPSANPKGDQFLENFRAWLTQRGCDTAAVEIRACQQVGLGFSLFLTVTTYTTNQTYEHLLQNPAAGLGMFAADAVRDRMHLSWWRRPVYWLLGRQDVALASFPLTSVVTARSITQDKKLGPIYKRLLDTGKHSLAFLHRLARQLEEASPMLSR